MSSPQSPGAPDEPGELTGFRVGVTAHRRAADFISALERRGAQVLHAPALRISPVAEDTRVVEDTRALLAHRPEVVVVTTAYGLRRWFEAADAAGLGEDLREAFRRARVLARGAKARGQVLSLELDDAEVAEDERTSSVVDRLLAEGVAGRRVAVQLHGLTDALQLERLVAAGARVDTVSPYRWLSADDGERLPALIREVCARRLDVLTFTAAPAVDALFSTAQELGRLEELVDALRSGVTAAAVGPVCAGPLREAGIEPVVPERYRLGALVRSVCTHVAEEHTLRAPTRFGPLEVRGTGAVLDGRFLALPDGQVAVLRALARAPGTVVPRSALLAGAESGHALEMTVSRLRRALPVPLVETVIKRGYRLAV
ncbi:uroporphyrinogen III synthetase [Kocuria flava]|uniref:Uroporphyrinogen III synthetase n=1 Tax=Kocuria flava TaxID=446860 RepID=A0A2N4T4M8_9MICC|nr:uroporphyrinogen-III synthase [Kocuria flava]PLC13173.1 uroporphyrinogen III synthetase [Kocuria flava]